MNNRNRMICNFISTLSVRDNSPREIRDDN